MTKSEDSKSFRFLSLSHLFQSLHDSVKKTLAIDKISERWIFEGEPLQRGCIGGINGIATTEASAKEAARYIYSLSENKELHWVYNATHGRLVDLAETVLVNSFKISHPARLLRKTWNEFDIKYGNDPKARYLQICHSQGALHVKTALLSAPQSIRDRIIVVSIAPAAIIPNTLCALAYNYASRKDPTAYAESLMETLSSSPNACNAKDYLSEIILLEPHPETPLLDVDHDFQSPTFTPVLRYHLLQFIDEYG